jgi:hypothetical protein
VSAPSTYLPYDLPLWLSQTLRHSARRAAVNPRRSIIWGCSLLALRPRPWMTPSRARASLLLRWHDLSEGERLPGHVPAPVTLREAQKPGLGVASSPRAPSSIRAQALAIGAGTSPAPAMPNWSRVTCSAGRRQRRSAHSAALLGPHMLSSPSPHHSTSSGLRRAEHPKAEPGLSAPGPANNRPRDASVALPGLTPSSDTRKQEKNGPDPKTPDPIPPIRRAPRVAAAGIPFEPSLPPELVHRPFAWHPAVLAAVWPRVTRLIEREVVRRAASAEPSAFTGELARPAGQSSVAPDTTPEVTDRMVAQVVTRLRALAREERFRAGRLR